VRLLTALSNPKADIRYAGADTALGKTVEIVEWSTPEGKPVRVFVDAATGLLVLLEQSELSPLGTGWVPVRRVYQDYRQAGRVRFPFQTTVYANGEFAAQQSLSDVKWNPGAPPSLFMRPSH